MKATGLRRLSTRNLEAAGGSAPTPAAPPPSVPGDRTGQQDTVGADELRARAYVKAALGETDAPTEEWWRSTTTEDAPTGPVRIEIHHHHYPAPDTAPPGAPGRGQRTADLSWLTANKARLTAITAGGLVQPALYKLAGDTDRLTPVGLLFMTGLVTGYWRVRHASNITRWLFTLNLTAGVAYLPALLLIVTVLTGATR